MNFPFARLLMIAALIALAGASCRPVPEEVAPGASIPTAAPSDTPTLPPPTPAATATPPPPTPTATPLSPRDAWAQRHEQERLRRLAEQGPAAGIPALEYHGDNYRFDYGGAIVELSPEAFTGQMQWFCENDFHAVSGAELIAWLNGEMQLPRKSVLLTFDMGARSSQRLDKMLTDFALCDLHGIVTIFPDMNMQSEKLCPNDACWEAYRRAYASGMVTIGSHSLTHRDFTEVPAAEGLNELAESKALLEAAIGQGCAVNILTWPYEAVPTWAPQIGQAGFVAAFGGPEYLILENRLKLDGRWFALPRVLPPNTSGTTGRPCCYDLPGMMEIYTAP